MRDERMAEADDIVDVDFERFPRAALRALTLVGNVIWAARLDTGAPLWANKAALSFFGAPSVHDRHMQAAAGALDETLIALRACAPHSQPIDAPLYVETATGDRRLIAQAQIIGLDDHEGPIALVDGAPLDDPAAERFMRAAFRALSTPPRLSEALREVEGLGQITRRHLALGARNRRLENANADLTRLATTDSLTGALNRRAFFDRCDRELKRAIRADYPCSVIVLDCDHFKSINDERGHAAGDAVLCELVQRIETAIRDCDFFGRLGGEEFAICLPDSDADGGVQVAERIRLAVANTPFEWKDAPISTTVSLGVAAFDGGAPMAFSTLLQAADEALYAAKAAGRNRFIRATTPTSPDG
ncbi:MAG: GGDEF domain-containing protein [Pseudomonadota bacterium]